MRMCARRESSRPPSTVASTGTPTCTGTGCWCGCCASYPQAPFAAQARSELALSFTPENIAAEVAYLKGAGRASFERPYGLAWLLQLAAELHAWDDPDARRWSGDARAA